MYVIYVMGLRKQSGLNCELHYARWHDMHTKIEKILSKL